MICDCSTPAPAWSPGCPNPPCLRRWSASWPGTATAPGSARWTSPCPNPHPWRAEAARGAGTLHLGGTRREIAAALVRVAAGSPAPRPFVLAGQPSVADASRAPAGCHALWAYCHVPGGWDGDAGPAIESQIERFAPGFRDTVLGRTTTRAAAWEAYNPNWIGGDVNGGVQDLGQMWSRPAGWTDPYCIRAPDLYLCSASTPPGGGVHGLCGWHAGPLRTAPPVRTGLHA